MDACEAAGGRFFPQAFGWMVHVYPYEQKAEDIWSVERQRETSRLANWVGARTSCVYGSFAIRQPK